MIELPISWILTALLSLSGVIATLAGIIWRSMQARLDAQDKIIEHFREDVTRLSKGCGFESCHWRVR
jgi:hypothetical protein